MSIKRFDGTNWVDVASAKRFDGTNWVEAQNVKRFDGANWVDAWMASGSLTFESNNIISLSDYNVNNGNLNCYMANHNSLNQWIKYNIGFTTPTLTNPIISFDVSLTTRGDGNGTSFYVYITTSSGTSGNFAIADSIPPLSSVYENTVNKNISYTINFLGGVYTKLGFEIDVYHGAYAFINITNFKVNGVLYKFV